MAKWLKQSTAVTLKIGPFLDETNGKDAETGLTISQADVRLSKNGANIAQKNESTACTHDELGVYDCPVDTTDTGTLGRLQLWVHESGALPVWHEYMIVPANVWDSMFGADYLQTHAVEITNDLITAAAIANGAIDAATFAADVDAEILSYIVDDATRIDASALNTASGTSIPAILTDTGTTLDGAITTIDGIVDAIKAKTDSLTFTVAGDVDCNVQTWKGAAAQDMTGDAFARLGAPAGASVSADIVAVKSDTAAILVDTGTTLDGKIDTIDGIVDAILVDTGTTLDGKINTIDDFLDTEVAAILEDTATTIPGLIAAVDGKIDTIDGIVDAILVDTGTTLQGELDGIQADTEDLQTQIGVAGAGLTAVPWNAAWDAQVQSEVFDALDAEMTDATSLTANGLLDRLRSVMWILRNKIAVTDANGNTVIYKDDSTTAGFTVNGMLTDDSTTTTRLRAA